jgi:NADH:ubiquinone oxidoreductase subunit C
VSETEWLQASEWLERARSLKGEGWAAMDLCGVDRLGLPRGEPRFEIVVQLIDYKAKDRRTVHVGADGEPPTIPSVVELWPTVDFMEREAYDMYGIVFDGHPNLTRILMPDEWEGHPLRKDYGTGKVDVEFVPQPFLQIDSPGQGPSGADARKDVDSFGQGQTGKDARESLNERTTG